MLFCHICCKAILISALSSTESLAEPALQILLFRSLFSLLRFSSRTMIHARLSKMPGYLKYLLLSCIFFPKYSLGSFFVAAFLFKEVETSETEELKRCFNQVNSSVSFSSYFLITCRFRKCFVKFSILIGFFLFYSSCMFW